MPRSQSTDGRIRTGALLAFGVCLGDFLADDADACFHVCCGHGEVDPDALIAVLPVAVVLAKEEVAARHD